MRGEFCDQMANQRTVVHSTLSSVKLNVEMTEWRVLLQKNLDIKVAKTHIWPISSLWAAVKPHEQLYTESRLPKDLFSSLTYFANISFFRLIDGFVTSALSTLSKILIECFVQFQLINELPNWNVFKGID